MYADDITLTIASPTLKQVEDILSHDMNIVQIYVKRWRSKLSKNKTVSFVFHIRNHQVNKQLKFAWINNKPSNMSLLKKSWNQLGSQPNIQTSH